MICDHDPGGKRPGHVSPDVLLLSQLRPGPRTWRQLAAAGLSRADVFVEINQLTQAGEAIFRVGPLLVARLDSEGAVE